MTIQKKKKKNTFEILAQYFCKGGKKKLFKIQFPKLNKNYLFSMQLAQY